MGADVNTRTALSTNEAANLYREASGLTLEDPQTVTFDARKSRDRDTDVDFELSIEPGVYVGAYTSATLPDGAEAQRMSRDTLTYRHELESPGDGTIVYEVRLDGPKKELQ